MVHYAKVPFRILGKEVMSETSARAEACVLALQQYLENESIDKNEINLSFEAKVVNQGEWNSRYMKVTVKEVSYE